MADAAAPADRGGFRGGFGGRGRGGRGRGKPLISFSHFNEIKI